MTSAPSKMVTRYSNWCAVTHGHEMMAKPDGSWVLFADYQIAIAELLTARLEIERLRAALHKIANPNARFEGQGECEAIARAALQAETPGELAEREEQAAMERAEDEDRDDERMRRERD